MSDPTNPRIAATLPRPTPPTDAPLTDFCQRRGSFGPKRTGYYTQPGTLRDGIVPYAFYNAGVQIFDVNDPEKAEIVAYFVPRFSEDVVEWARGNLAHGIYVEYDRKHHLALYQPWILCALDSGSWRAEIERARDSLAATLMTDCALASYKDDGDRGAPRSRGAASSRNVRRPNG